MSEPDWGQLRERVRRYLKARAREFNLNDADIDDLCSEVVLAVLSYGKSHTIESDDAFAIVCAQRAAKDLAFSRRRWQIIDTPLDGATSPPGPMLGDPVDRIHTIVILVFKSREPGCLELAKAYFKQRPWHDVAESVGQTATAIRQQWSRCVKKLRAVISTDKELARLLDLDPDEDPR